jgi:hypothetical protein
MKRLGFVLGILAAMVTLPLRAQGKAPLIVFDGQTKDFGKILEGETIKHVFTFTNKGTATLEILKTEAG